MPLRLDQINLLLHGSAGRKFMLNAHARLATLYPIPCVLTLIMAVEGGPSVHLSICIQSGPHCLLLKILFAALHIMFAGLLLHVAKRKSRVSEQHVSY